MNEKVIYDSLECILKMLKTLVSNPEVLYLEEVRKSAENYIDSVLTEIEEVND